MDQKDQNDQAEEIGVIKAKQKAAETLLDKAEQMQWAGKGEEAVKTCQEAMRLGALTVHNLLRVVMILRGVGADAAADQLSEALMAQLTQAHEADPDNPNLSCEMGFALMKLGREDEAVPFLEASIGGSEDVLRPVYMLADMYLRRKSPDEALDVWRKLSEAYPEDGDMMLRGAAMMAHFGAKAQARAILDLARPHVKGRHQEYAHIAAYVGGSDEIPDQASVAQEIFDGFAESYDYVLGQIGNNGPVMVAQMMEKLGIEKSGTLRVLDAGCGTGLCAPYLRPYAVLIHGIDLSPGMLTQASTKGVYEYLTRSDIARLDTMPAGPFDVVVAADVFTYFKDLGTPLANFASLMPEGGTVIFTVEQATEEEGVQIASTGRYKHPASYVAEQIKAAGFEMAPERIEAPLRFEYAEPVPGLCVAARKPV